MTPTEQDKELREAICDAMHVHPEELQYNLPNSFGNSELEAIMQLITADRKRVALEARINTAEHIQNTMVSPTSAYYDEISANEIPDYIAELKAQQKD
jgi:hypothetical protein